MKYSEVVDTIFRLCNDSSFSFAEKGEQLERELASCTLDEIIEHINYAGVIPECFGHDSTEEKVYAKYCDALFARALRELGLDAQAIDARSDAADVEAKAPGYTLVGDAKAFRLSRTAKNQKDFKVEALNQWRKGADYACLLAPLYQYPNKNSQIYDQAIRYNVTLLSYTHLAFLLRHRENIKELQPLWEVGKNLGSGKSASEYWDTILKIVLTITGTSIKNWKRAVDDTLKFLAKQVDEQQEFWKKEKKRITSLNHKEAIEELIKNLKINKKISDIGKWKKLSLMERTMINKKGNPS